MAAFESRHVAVGFEGLTEDLRRVPLLFNSIRVRDGRECNLGSEHTPTSRFHLFALGSVCVRACVSLAGTRPADAPLIINRLKNSLMW